MDANENTRDEWHLAVVEDTEAIANQIKEYFEGLDDSRFNVTIHRHFDQALEQLRSRVVDVLILDVYNGAPAFGDKSGLQTLKEWKQYGFAPVVLYSALASSVENEASAFVRVVPKDDGLVALGHAVSELIGSGVPFVHRRLQRFFREALSFYMWSFLDERWSDIEPYTNSDDRCRLLLRRVISGFTHEQSLSESSARDAIHPYEYYIQPPIGDHPQLGDIRVRPNTAPPEYHIVLWPSCDLVQTVDRPRKVDSVLCGRIVPVDDQPEFAALAEALDGLEAIERQLETVSDLTPHPDRKKAQKAVDAARKALGYLCRNTRKLSGTQPARYHFLPAALDLPAGLVDFACLHQYAAEEIEAWECVATLDSPFAESLSSRFTSYISRLGTPDLDHKTVLDHFERLTVQASNCDRPGGDS